MIKIAAKMVKELRERTGVGMMDCKTALMECDGDFEKSVSFLRKKGVVNASKRSSRSTLNGTVQSYVHFGGVIGVLVEIGCETDFFAKTVEFIQFAKNIAMHIAATDPISLFSDDIPKNIVEREMEVYKAQALEMGKGSDIVDKVVKGKMVSFFKENCLINQKYVKDPTITVEEYLNDMISRTGEKIIIKRFVRFRVGEA